MNAREADVRAELRDRLGALRRVKRADAVVEAARAAVLAVVPRLRAGLESATRRRAELPPREPTVSRTHDVMTVTAILLGILSPAMVLPSRNGDGAFDVGDGAIWAGGFAAASLIWLVIVDSDRVNSKYLGARSGNARRLYVFFAILWAFVFVSMIVQWDETNRYEQEVPIFALVLLAVSSLGALVLAWRSRRADRAHLAAHGEEDEPDRLDPVDDWWATMARTLSPAERGAGDTSYRIALEVLVEERVIRERDARRLRRKKPPVVWAGDAA